MDNILNFPSTTIVNKPVPKNAFYGRSNDSSLREFLTREFEGIIWLYKLAPATLNVEDGEHVHEIDVFYCKMKENNYSLKPLCAMDELLPRHTVFVIAYGGKFDLLMHHKEMALVRGTQQWKCGVSELKQDIQLNANLLRIQGQSMDAVYNGLLSQVSGLSISAERGYKEQAELRKQIEILQKQVVTLQKRIKAEKQFNRQIELNTEVRQHRKEIALLTDKLNKKNI